MHLFISRMNSTYVVLAVVCLASLLLGTWSSPASKRVSQTFTDQWCQDKFGEYVITCTHASNQCCHLLEPYHFTLTGNECQDMNDTECRTNMFTTCCKDGKEMAARYDENSMQDTLFMWEYVLFYAVSWTLLIYYFSLII